MALGIVLDREELQAHYPPRTDHQGSGRKEAYDQIRALASRKGLVWEPCFNHKLYQSSSGACAAAINGSRAARSAGFKVKTWHTKDGSLCVVRLS